MKQEGEEAPSPDAWFFAIPFTYHDLYPSFGGGLLYSFDKIHYPKYTTLPQFFEPVTWTKRPTTGPTGEGPQS